MTVVQVHVAVNGVVVFKGQAESVGRLADNLYHWHDNHRASGELVHDDDSRLSLAAEVLQASIAWHLAAANSRLNAMAELTAEIGRRQAARIGQELPEPRSVDPQFWPKGYAPITTDEPRLVSITVTENEPAGTEPPPLDTDTTERGIIGYFAKPTPTTG